MHLVCPLQKLDASHRGHIAGGEQREHGRVRCRTPCVQPLQRRIGRLLTYDFVVLGVPTGQLPTNHVEGGWLVVHGQQSRRCHEASPALRPPRPRSAGSTLSGGGACPARPAPPGSGTAAAPPAAGQGRKVEALAETADRVVGGCPGRSLTRWRGAWAM